MIKVIRFNRNNSDFQKLVKTLDDELDSRYGIIQADYNEYNKIENIENIVIAYQQMDPAGCGCFKVFDHHSVEIKRMIVKPEYRGMGIAKLILLELESWAVEKGFSRSILETGMKQPEAINFYSGLGYSRIDNWGQYIGNENSICMSKTLQ